MWLSVYYNRLYIAILLSNIRMGLGKAGFYSTAKVPLEPSDIAFALPLVQPGQVIINRQNVGYVIWMLRFGSSCASLLAYLAQRWHYAKNNP